MNTLPLPGLKGSEPIGFLAAVGLLRVLTARRSFGAVKLGWSDDSAWTAVLYTEKPCDETLLIEDFVVHMENRSSAPEFNGRGICPDLVGNQTRCWLSPSLLNDVKIALESYRQLLDVTRSGARWDQREPVNFYSALGSELIPLGNKDEVKPSALHMTSGNQAFLESARELAQSLDPGALPHPKAAVPPREAFREALFAQSNDGQTGWRAADKFSALGFDPTREAIYALTATAPGPAGPRSTRAAVWLAIEALPLFPVLPVKGRLHTRAFDLRATTALEPRATVFRWPIWDGTLSTDAIRTALGVPELFDDHTPIGALQRLAFRAVMESERVTIGQGYGQLRPAVKVR